MAENLALVVDNTNSGQKAKTMAEALTNLELGVGEKFFVYEGDEISSFVNTKGAGIYDGEDGYYKVTAKLTEKKLFVDIVRLTNFTMKFKNKVIRYDFNNPDYKSHLYEISVKINNQVQDIVVEHEELSDLSIF